MAINLKDFKIGQKVYILNPQAMSINEEIVLSIGRKYLTSYIENSSYNSKTQYYVNLDIIENALVENKDWGTIYFLFSSKKDIEDYQEKQQLQKWFYNFTYHPKKLTLQQLRDIKQIIDPEDPNVLVFELNKR